MAARPSSSSEDSDGFIEEEPPQPKIKEHFIWKFFSIPEGLKKVNAPKVECKICQTVLSRGDPRRKYSFGNSTMIRHVQRRHPQNYARESVRDLARNPPRDGASTSTGGATTSGRGRAAELEMIPNIQPVFSDITIKCKQCDEMLCYGEQSIKLIARKRQEHRCLPQP